MANIFQLFGQVFIDNAEANKSIDTTTKKAESSGSKVKSAFSSIAKGAAAVGAAVVGAASTIGAAAYKMATGTASQADVIDKLSERTSINREEIQRWMHACDQSGVSQDALTSAIKKLSTNLESKKAGGLLKQIGLSLEEIDGLPIEEKFSKITSALADMEDGTTRNALGAQLLGGSYTEMLPLLNAGSDGIAALKQEADDLGIVMSENDVKAGVKLGDTIANVKAAFNGMKNAIGSAVVPIVQKFTDLIINAIPKIQTLVEKVTPVITNIFDTIMPLLFVFIETIFPVLVGFIEQLLPVLEGIIASILPVIVELLQQLLPLFLSVVQNILPLILDLIVQLMPFIEQIITAILPVIIKLIERLLPYVVKIIERLLPVIINLIERLLPVILEIIDTVLPVLLDLIDALMPLLLDVIDAVLPILVDLIEQVLPPIVEIIRAVLPVLLNLIKAVLPIITTIIQAVLPIFIEQLKLLAPILTPIFTLISELLIPLAELLNGILTPIVTVIQSIIEKIMPVLTSVFKSFIGLITGQFSGAFEMIKHVFSNAINIFKNIIDFVKNVFTGNWKGAWENIKNIFASVWDHIKMLVKAPINFIIDGLNVLIRGLNKISFDIPDWVPFIGGKKFGINLPEVPKLRVGMEYVPYDDFPALLHKGEKVLTASEAKETREKERTEPKAGEKEVKISLSLNIENFYNSGEKDVESLADELMEIIAEKIRQKGAIFA